MPTGHILKVITTDPSSEQDIPMFAKHTGNLLVGQENLAGTWVFYLRRR
jgi:tRNA 2-thiouridine synthesizing protein A